MDDKSWIKLYRKILTKGMLRDHAAYILFSYLLLKNRDGKVIVSRYATSKELRMNPNTFKSALKRLEKKWQSVTTLVTNDCTIVQITHWLQYQSDKMAVTKSDTTQTPPRHHPDTTYKENKELRNKSNKLITVSDSLTEQDLQDISVSYKVPIGLVNYSWETLKNYCASSGKQYKDYKAALRNFVLKEMKTRTMERRPDNAKRAIDASQL